MNERWAAWLPALLLVSSCIQARRFEDDGAGGTAPQNASAGQGGVSANGPAAEPQAGASVELSECFLGPSGEAAGDCVRSSLAAGDGFSCGLLAAGGILCWGEDSDGQVTGAPQTGNFVSVAAGRRHACALRPDGTLKCWGNNSQQQAPAQAAGEPYGHFKSIACGDDFTCGVHFDGSPLCFGSFAYNKSNPPNGPYTMIATGADTACGIRADTNHVVCWGDDTWGIVSSANSGAIAKLVAVGPEHACVLTSERQLKCWGNGTQAGDAQAGTTRTDVRSGEYFAVSAGGVHTAAITVGDHFTCFGDASATWQCTSPTLPEYFGAWYQVAAGKSHTCILGDPMDAEVGPNGTVECFGLGNVTQSPDRLFKSGK